MKKIIIFGASDAAELAHYYFTRDSSYSVEAFAVDASYLAEQHRFCGLDVVAFEEVEKDLSTGGVRFLHRSGLFPSQ